ncbi:unnamed protein product [Protopolystoma xenopodis]|uniref:Uncharacterized protein n=1 Tax=Protopolystoma xenopodis TaxID=117903 RepID=A0A448XR03_9PLAT|nr:unnamed protein product [Protopolystoma xenopodis]
MLTRKWRREAHWLARQLMRQTACLSRLPSSTFTSARAPAVIATRRVAVRPQHVRQSAWRGRRPKARCVLEADDVETDSDSDDFDSEVEQDHEKEKAVGESESREDDVSDKKAT